MLKKKILFVINSLTIGGSEKSLVSLLNTIDYSKYEVDLMMFKKGEDFDIYIPKEVNILEEPDYYKVLNKHLEDVSIKNKMRYLFTRLKTSLNLRINSYKSISINSEQVLYKSQKVVFDKIDKIYDVAIAYSQGMPTYFVADKVNACKKISWINCDYSTTIYDKDVDELFYSKFNKIIAVSKTIEESIIKIKPKYKDKIEVILDIVNPELIKKMAEEEIVLTDKSYTSILTVARLDINHKGYDTAIKTARMLKDNNYKFKWFIVGEGHDRINIEKLIKENNLEEYCILLGKKENPYPYIKNCDIYVQPSKKEGFGLTVMEAKILNKAIVCTNFNTARELINNEDEGLIVNDNYKDVYSGITKYMKDSKFKIDIENNLRGRVAYDSTKEIEKIYRLIH